MSAPGTLHTKLLVTYLLTSFPDFFSLSLKSTGIGSRKRSPKMQTFVFLAPVFNLELFYSFKGIVNNTPTYPFDHNKCFCATFIHRAVFAFVRYPEP